MANNKFGNCQTPLSEHCCQHVGNATNGRDANNSTTCWRQFCHQWTKFCHIPTSWHVEMLGSCSSVILSVVVLFCLSGILSELDHTLTQCSPINFGVSVWSSRITDPGLMTSLMTSSRRPNNLCRNFGAKYLGNKARWRDGFNRKPIGTCLWPIDCACSPWLHVTEWRHSGDVIIFSLKYASSPAILVRIGPYFNTMFPYMVCLYTVLTHSWSESYDVTDVVIT